MEVCAWAANPDNNTLILTHQPTSKNLGIHVSPQQRLRKGNETGIGGKNLPAQPNRERDQQQQHQHQQQATTSQTMYVGTRTSILLQTAKVNIYKPGMQENRINARLILDSGSQRSFVTTRVKNQLNLDAEGTENLMIKTFGGEAEELQTCEFLHFNIETESTYPDLSLTAFVVSTICQPLRHQTTHSGTGNLPSSRRS